LDVPALDSEDLLYNYVPTEWVCITFVVLFSLSTGKLLSDLHFSCGARPLHCAFLFRYSHACRASDPFPLMVAIPDRCCLRNYRNNRVEWPIVVQQEPLPAHAVPYAVRLCRSSSAFTVTLSMKRDRISTTIMAPSFLIAANFIILGRITRRLGPQFCRLSPLHCE
jgi:hypothetical protein